MRGSSRNALQVMMVRNMLYPYPRDAVKELRIILIVMVMAASSILKEVVGRLEGQVCGGLKERRHQMRLSSCI